MMYCLFMFAGLMSLSTGRYVEELRSESYVSVDLGYEVHTATINTTGDYYIFSNIPYAEQPVNDFRFQLPVAITSNSSAINDGSKDAICIQGAPLWSIEEEADSDGQPIELIEEFFWATANQTEACLLLDVYVPASIFDEGSGANTGHKDTDPAGLIARSQLDNGTGIVFVTIQYRLGLYGWLGGADDAIPNLGLHDQLLALQWVQQYISRFGGDPDQVTVMGESAGGSSIVFHVTSFGGNNTLPFQRAITQSPAFQFNLNMTAGYELTMQVASNVTGTNVSTVADLTSLDTATLKAINEQTILLGNWGDVVFGPAPDGSYVPKLPQVLLAEGNVNKDIELLIGHNSFEATTFVDPNITSETDLLTRLTTEFPEISNLTLTYILDDLYPAANYSSPFARAVQISSDSSFSCITRYLALAKGNQTYNYLFAIPPGEHAEDVPYTFYDGDESTPDDGFPVDVEIVYALQDAILGFLKTGDPNEMLGGVFPVYESNASVLVFNNSGLSVQRDDMDNVRCAWWQQAMVEGLV